MGLRPYQKECIDIINKKGEGRWLIQMATGLGKGHILPHIKRIGKKLLIIVHRQELLNQLKEKFKHDSTVKIITIQALLNLKSVEKFDETWLDEAHRYSVNSKWGKKILEFNVKRILGFTATPNRTDSGKLPFDEIIYDKDVIFGIKNGYLAPLYAEAINIGYDISNVAKTMGDFKKGELEKAVNIESANKAIAEVFKGAPKPVLIFAVNIAHAEAIAKECNIPSVTQKTKTKNRAQIIEDCRNNKINGIVSVDVFTEGLNINNAKSLIMARPTQSELLYLQIIGRILRLAPGKEQAYLYDCVGATGKHSLCGAYTLVGLDLETLPEERKSDIYGDLLDINDKAEEIISLEPETWIKNRQIVNLYARKNKFSTRGINFIKHPDGNLIVGLLDDEWIGITKLNHLKQTYIISSGNNFKLGPMNPDEAIKRIYETLCRRKNEQKTIWDWRAISRWGKAKATEKQKNYANLLLKNKGIKFNVNKLNKQELSIIIARLKYEQQRKKIRENNK